MTFLATRKTGVFCFEILYVGNSLLRCFTETGVRQIFKCKEETKLTNHTDHVLSIKCEFP